MSSQSVETPLYAVRPEIPGGGAACPPPAPPEATVLYSMSRLNVLVTRGHSAKQKNPKKQKQKNKKKIRMVTVTRRQKNPDGDGDAAPEKFEY